MAKVQYYWQDMNIQFYNTDLYLVTGAKGQLGSEWVRYLRANGMKFHSFGSAELDITDFSLVRSTISEIRPTVIINCAAYTKVDRAESDAEVCDMVNNKAVENLARICSEYGILLVHYSTDYVFEGAASDRLDFPDGYPVRHSGNPQNEYGRSKFRGESAVMKHCRKYILIRVSWLCGSSGHNFVRTMLHLGRQKSELQVVNDQFGSPSYANEVVSISRLLIENRNHGLYHVSAAGLLTWFDFAAEIMMQSKTECLVKSVDSSAYPSKVKRPGFSKLDCKETEIAAGIKMTDWKTGLRNLLAELEQEV